MAATASLVNPFLLLLVSLASLVQSFPADDDDAEEPLSSFRLTGSLLHSVLLRRTLQEEQRDPLLPRLGDRPGCLRECARLRSSFCPTSQERVRRSTHCPTSCQTINETVCTNIARTVCPTVINPAVKSRDTSLPRQIITTLARTAFRRFKGQDLVECETVEDKKCVVVPVRKCASKCGIGKRDTRRSLCADSCHDVCDDVSSLSCSDASGNFYDRCLAFKTIHLY